MFATKSCLLRRTSISFWAIYLFSSRLTTAWLAQLVERRTAVCLKITEENVLPLLLHLQMVGAWGSNQKRKALVTVLTRCSCSKRDVVTVKWYLGRLVYGIRLCKPAELKPYRSKVILSTWEPCWARKRAICHDLNTNNHTERAQRQGHVRTYNVALRSRLSLHYTSITCS